MARRIRRENLRSHALHRCLDVGINWMAMACAYMVKEGFEIGIPTEPLAPPIIYQTFLIVALIWLVTASAMETYAYKRRLFNEIVNLLAVLIVTIAFFNTYAYFTRYFVFPRYFMIFYAVLAAAGLVLGRSLKHLGQRLLHRYGYGLKRVILIGTGPTARRLAKTFRRQHSLGYQFLGFISLPEEEPPAHDQLGTLDELEAIINREQPDEVVIALPGHHHTEVLNIAHRCGSANLRLRVVPDLFEVIMVRASLSEIDDIPLIGLRDPVITGYQSIVKRIFDVAVACFCILLALPLLVIIPIAILLDSGRPVFFLQWRIGENGKPFRMFKFRSMVPDAEQRLRELVDIGSLPQPAFKIPDDPRVTRVGRWLRRTSLDELPQLFNVLKGDMSMVGPRPEEMQVVEHYQLWHRKRLAIKPGITGPMQVSGRGILPLDERIKLELMYINRYSILEDIKYLLKTIPAVVRGVGAY